MRASQAESCPPYSVSHPQAWPQPGKGEGLSDSRTAQPLVMGIGDGGGRRKFLGMSRLLHLWTNGS